MLPSFGVQFTNKIGGAFRLRAEDGEERPARLELTGELPNLLSALLSARVSLKGVISLTGFADDKPVSGQMEIMPLRGMRLELKFADNQGADCRLESAKDFEISDAFKGKSELKAALRGASGQELGSVRLDIDLLQSFGQFWGSLRKATS